MFAPLQPIKERKTIDAEFSLCFIFKYKVPRGSTMLNLTSFLLLQNAYQTLFNSMGMGLLRSRALLSSLRDLRRPAFFSERSKEGCGGSNFSEKGKLMIFCNSRIDSLVSEIDSQSACVIFNYQVNPFMDHFYLENYPTNRIGCTDGLEDFVANVRAGASQGCAVRLQSSTDLFKGR